MNRKGFTLVELVLFIAILGVLAVTALPNIFNISLTNARANARDAVVAAVQTGLSLYAANQVSQGNAISYPAALDGQADGTAASRSNPLYTNVLQAGVTRDWTKVNSTCYTYTGGGVSDEYEYDNTNGTFLYQSGGC